MTNGSLERINRTNSIFVTVCVADYGELFYYSIDHNNETFYVNFAVGELNFLNFFWKLRKKHVNPVHPV
jgi:hypothetical protein